MKKLTIAAIICFTLLIPNNEAKAAMNPKTKAFLVMTSYGTVGGALLGFASLAFGGKSRAIAQGASLGLYAGIAFGAYVISSYNKKEEETYEPAPYYDSPYPPSNNEGFGAPVPQAAPDDGGGFFGNRIDEINDKYMTDFGGHTKTSSMPPIYVNLLNMSF